MGILTPEELEKSLFDAINQCYQNRKRLLVYDYFGFIMQYFDNDFEEYKKFLEQLAEKQYIKFEGPGTPAIMFGEKAFEWRKKLADLFPGQPQNIANQTFNISHANHVQAAGRDINTLTENDAEQLVKVLQQVIPTGTDPNSLSGKVRSWLDCGSSAIAIIKGILSI